MSCRNARFRPPRNRDGDNHELPLVRRGGIHRRSVDHSCVLAPTTGETPKLVAEVFTIKRGRCAADNGFAHLRLQFVGVYHGSVLVFDQLVRAYGDPSFPEKIRNRGVATATKNPRERMARLRSKNAPRLLCGSRLGSSPDTEIPS